MREQEDKFIELRFCDIGLIVIDSSARFGWRRFCGSLPCLGAFFCGAGFGLHPGSGLAHIAPWAILGRRHPAGFARGSGNRK